MSDDRLRTESEVIRQEIREKKMKDLQEEMKAQEKFNDLVFQEFKKRSIDIDLPALQFSDDFSMISKTIIEWQKKAKSDTQKNVIKEIETALIRMLCHNQELSTISKRAQAEYSVINQIVSRQALKLRDLKKENDLLKKEIKYYEESGDHKDRN